MTINVSLCVSGKWTDVDYTDRLREIVPHDNFYTATYVDCDYDSTFKMVEPENTYNPVLDTEPYNDQESKGRRNILPTHGDIAERYYNKFPNWHKQILIHNHMMKNIPKCDVVIRSRFDAFVSQKIDWKSFINESYDNDLPIGFNTVHWKEFYKYHTLRDMDKHQVYYINDALLIHPYDCWNCDLVDELYNDKKLKGAEEGWYQVLSEPHGHWHKSLHGGVYLHEYRDIIIDADENVYN